MRALLIRSTAVLTLLLACTHPVSRPESSANPGIPAGLWPPAFFPRFDSVAALAGLEPLRTGGGSAREVRIWIGSGPEDLLQLYRFVEDGGAVDGELLFYWWRALGDPPPTIEDLNGRCHGFASAGSVGVCHARLIRRPDWRAVLRRVEAAGLWSITDAAEHGESDIPQPCNMTVELWDGASYRAYRRTHAQPPSAPDEYTMETRVWMIAQALGAVDPIQRLLPSAHQPPNRWSNEQFEPVFCPLRLP